MSERELEMLSKDRPNEQYNWLYHEKSPYLQQHKSNPVNWYPWGTTAFQKAQREGKAVFLSIGYS